MKKNVIIGIVIGAVLLTGSTVLAANGGRFGDEYHTQTVVCDTNGDGRCDASGNPVGTGSCDQSGNCQQAPAQSTTPVTDTSADTAATPSAQTNHTVCDTDGDGLCNRSGNPIGTGNCDGTGNGCGYGQNGENRGQGNGTCGFTQRGQGSGGQHRKNCQ